MKKIIFIFLLLCVTFSSFAEKEHTNHWDYQHQNEWTYEHGTFQSPININLEKTKKSSSIDGIYVNYSTTPSYIIDNGHAIQIGTEGNNAMINDREFNLLQFHYHSLSEHTINGKHFPLEGHFVHSSEDGRLAVIGVMYKEGQYNPEFQKILINISKEKQHDLSIDIDYDKLLPQNKSYYHYLGSLTTPPLTENVEWYILSTPVEISKKQITEFNKYYSYNYRDIQELHNRTVLYHK